jgi:hypothetical protein
MVFVLVPMDISGRCDIGCGCGGKRRDAIRGVGPRPIVTPRNRSAQTGIPRSARQINQISALASKSLTPEKDARRMMIEKKRRELIKLRKISRSREK